ncbi:MAG: biopolymer transporter ExbD [Candidatus Merdousia sp.]|nr:biopolymer transporter ExbD [Candidatus Merdousia sp.]
MSLRRPNFSDGEGEESINISPLIDVIFILLIFFVVTTTFSDGGAVKIDVPKAATAVRPESKPLTISIAADSSVSVGGVKVSRTELEARLRAHMRFDKTVVLRGDSSAPVSTLVEIMDTAKLCGAEEIYVSAEKK